ncbi:hypothetical protein BAY61_24095 [Prauserella marina]|uniref:hypothetical protein n=1 Tax=Prauserella marina TaxID=530584 RepID=UPI000B87FF5E|nr:hypothetical protein [Prauserella marina]ASR37574.1 hypothetical protein BAY61_24095 [Prauserella marina]
MRESPVQVAEIRTPVAEFCTQEREFCTQAAEIRTQEREVRARAREVRTQTVEFCVKDSEIRARMRDARSVRAGGTFTRAPAPQSATGHAWPETQTPVSRWQPAAGTPMSETRTRTSAT